jgi:REP element-mobilizing transposase RayT
MSRVPKWTLAPAFTASERSPVPRKHRDTGAGLFHVYTHCVWAAPALYRDDADRLTFLRELAAATAKFGWTCVAYCVMTTHYHLILGVADDVLPKGMHAVNFRYACYFNRRHASLGHVQAARYGSRRIDGDADLLSTFRYVARNPVEAGLCATPAEWPWSSYAGTVGVAKPQPFVDASVVIRCFGDDREAAIRALRAVVEEAR